MANMRTSPKTSPKTISNRDNKTFIPSKERDFVLKNWFCFVLRSILEMKIYQNYQWKASFNFTPQVFKLMMITNLRKCMYRLEQYFALHIWIIIFHIISRMTNLIIFIRIQAQRKHTSNLFQNVHIYYIRNEFKIDILTPNVSLVPRSINPRGIRQSQLLCLIVMDHHRHIYLSL